MRCCIGVLPFGAMFIELFFIFSAIWENQYYYLFGFLFLVFIIIIGRSDGDRAREHLFPFQSRALKSPSLSLTFNYAAKTITGGGVRSSPRAVQRSTSSPTRSSTSSQRYGDTLALVVFTDAFVLVGHH